MLSRSAWRAAKVLRGAKVAAAGGNASSSSTTSDLDSRCTCQLRQQQQQHQKSRAESTFATRSRLNSNAPFDEPKFVDVKGKGREVLVDSQQASKSSKSDPPSLATDKSATIPTRSQAVASSSAPIAAPSVSVTEIPFRVLKQRLEHLLFQREDDFHIIRDSWLAFSRISLDRRKDLSVETLQQLASVQKRLPDKHRWKLWSRLLEVYRAWAGYKTPLKIILQSEGRQQEQIQIRPLPPVEELKETLDMIQDWLPMDEDLAARSLCAYILKLVSPVQHPEVLHQGLDILLSSGNAYYMRITAERVLDSMQLNSRARTHGGLEESKRLSLEDASTRIVCALAESLATRMAAKFARACLANGFGIDEERSRRALACGMLVKYSQEDDPVGLGMQEYDGWYDSPELHDEDRARWRNEMHSTLQSVVTQENLDGETHLFLLKTLFRAILSGKRTESGNIVSTNGGISPSPADEYLVQGRNALRVLTLYDQCLSQGILPDKGLYDLVGRAKGRLPLHASIESPALREAAWRHASNVRAQAVQNPKEKWSAPISSSPHAARYQEERLDDDRSAKAAAHVHKPHNPFLGSSLPDILRLAVQVGDMHLARSVHLMLAEDPHFRWQPDDSDIARRLLQTLVDDALHIPYDAEESMHRTVQLACDFYTRWRNDLHVAGVWPDNDGDMGVARTRSPMDGRRPRRYGIPSSSLLRLLALNDNERSFDAALDTLLLDSHTEVTAPRVEWLVNMLLARGSHPRTSMKLQQLTEALAYSPRHEHLVAHVLSSIHGSRKISFNEYEGIVAFDRVYAGLKKLGFRFTYNDFATILSTVYGKGRPHPGTVVEDMVNAYQKLEYNPAEDMQRLLAFAIARCSNSMTCQEFLDSFTAQTLSDADVARLGARFEHLLTQSQVAEATLVRDTLRAIVRLRGIGSDDNLASLLEHMQEMLKPFAKAITIEDTSSLLSTVASTPPVQATSPLTVEAHAQLAAEDTKPEHLPSLGITSAPSFLASFFTTNESTQGDATAQQQPVLGFREAAGRNNQAAAASTDDSMIAQAREQDQVLASSFGRASQPALAPSVSSSQAYSTLAHAHGTTPVINREPSSPQEQHYATQSFLHDLSQLPQQFADMTIEQIIAWKRRCEIEYEALRRRDADFEQSRRMVLARADASRWHGWQEHQATPWY